MGEPELSAGCVLTMATHRLLLPALAQHVLDEFDQCLFDRFPLASIGQHDRDVGSDGECLPDVLGVVSGDPVEAVHCDNVGKSPILDEVNRRETVREPAGVDEDDHADGAAHEVIPHEPEAMLARRPNR